MLLDGFTHSTGFRLLHRCYTTFQSEEICRELHRSATPKRVQYMALTDYAFQVIERSNSSVFPGHMMFSCLAVECQESYYNGSSPIDFQIKKNLAEAQTPLMKGLSTMTMFQHMCTGWPATTRNPPHRIYIPPGNTLPKILMVNALFDPATPYTMAANMRDEIGKDRVSLVTR